MTLSFEDPDLREEFEISWEEIILQWLHQLEEMESPDELEELEEVV
jgi:hypothetical protein